MSDVVNVYCTERPTGSPLPRNRLALTGLDHPLHTFACLTTGDRLLRQRDAFTQVVRTLSGDQSCRCVQQHHVEAWSLNIATEQVANCCHVLIDGASSKSILCCH